MAQFTEIESVHAAGIVDASSESLLEEIRARQRRMSLLPLAILVAVMGGGIAMVMGQKAWLVVLAGIAMIVAASYRDRAAKTVVVQYELQPAVEQAFARFTEWGRALAASQRAWSVAASGRGHDQKYHAGANELVQRSLTSIRIAAPPMLRTNVPVLSIGVGRQMLYFLPDRLLIYDRGSVGAVSYRTLEVLVTKRRFVEDGGAPSDAAVVDWTWRYVNKSGGPDRRFRANPQVPICLYDEVTFRTPSGLHEVVQVSRADIAGGFAAAIRHLATVVA